MGRSEIGKKKKRKGSSKLDEDEGLERGREGGDLGGECMPCPGVVKTAEGLPVA